MEIAAIISFFGVLISIQLRHIRNNGDIIKTLLQNQPTKEQASKTICKLASIDEHLGTLVIHNETEKIRRSHR